MTEILDFTTIQRINSAIYRSKKQSQKYKDDLGDIILNSEIEKEIRFKPYVNREDWQRSSLNMRTYYGTKNKYSHLKSTKTNTTTIMIKDSPYRLTIDNETGDETFIRKEIMPDGSIDISDYRMRIMISTETVYDIGLIENSEDIQNEFIDDIMSNYSLIKEVVKEGVKEGGAIIRNRIRESYKLLGGRYTLDFTKVTGTDINGEKIRDTYEIELEADVLSKESNSVINSILKNILDTDNLYTIDQYIDIVNVVNDAMHHPGYKIPTGKHLEVNEEGNSVEVSNFIPQESWGDESSFDHRILFDARNLQIDDLVDGGITGKYLNVDNINEAAMYMGTDISTAREMLESNPNLSVFYRNEERDKNGDLAFYTVTNKADGLRKLLVFAHNGLWLVMGPSSANYVINRDEFLNRIKNDSRRESFNEFFAINEGYIFEGELIPKENRNGANTEVDNLYFIYDTLSIPQTDNVGSNPYDNSIQRKALGNRLNMAYNITRIAVFKDQKFPINIYRKRFIPFATPDEFYTAVRQLLSSQENLPYETDGIIFTPNLMPYNSYVGSKKIDLWDRKLTRYADICKWKDTSTMSIDLAYMIENGNVSLNTLDKNGKIVKFEGTKRFKLASSDIDIRGWEDQINSGSIVEFRWNQETNKMIPMRIRLDKNKPNKKEFAIDNWKLMRLPISKETMFGDNLVLMRRYHNRIKRSIYDDALKKVGNSSRKTLLDIGSGRGGDLAKWQDFDLVISVEPNAGNINEFVSRVKNMNKRDFIKIKNANDLKDNTIQRIKKAGSGAQTFGPFIILIETRGEDLTTIKAVMKKIGLEKVNVVSSMLSMSFFWGSSDNVNTLARTISQTLDPNGVFVYFTIDGDSVRHKFVPTFSNGEELTDIKTGNYMISYAGKRKLKISIDIQSDNPIVSDQEEWLVFTNDLELKLREKLGFVSDYKFKSDKEKFLNYEERFLTNLYTYGLLRRA